MLQIKNIHAVKMVRNPHDTGATDTGFLSRGETAPARHFHESLKLYEPTPLVELSALAGRGGVRSILVKDESKRFGLNAFKGLGGSYALFRAVCQKLGLDYQTMTLEQLKAAEYREKLASMEFVTTTDGNHGRGVSWAAGMLGCKAHVFMPRGSVEARAQAIRDAGSAEVTITNLCYDDAVRYAARMAEEHGWFLVQDTAWEGYEEVPAWIIQGYTTMVYEALEQMAVLGYQRPTHVFLQAGVGAMAGGVLGALKCTYGNNLPSISIVEPDQVACIFESAHRHDGKPHAAVGSGSTIMAGLNCGEPCRITWPILRDYPDFYFACPDTVAARGMRMLAAPLEGDRPIISGESGAVSAGLVSLLLHDPEYAGIRQRMRLDEHAVILLINTEGNTDPENYFDVVYNGKYPMD